MAVKICIAVSFEELYRCKGANIVGRGQIVLSYIALAKALSLPENAQIQWAEEGLNRSSIVIFVDHPTIPQVKPGKFFPKLCWTKDGWRATDG